MGEQAFKPQPGDFDKPTGGLMADIFRQYNTLYGEGGEDPSFMALAASAALHVAAVVVFFAFSSLSPSPVLSDGIIRVRLLGDDFQSPPAASVQKTATGPAAPPAKSTQPDKSTQVGKLMPMDAESPPASVEGFGPIKTTTQEQQPASRVTPEKSRPEKSQTTARSTEKPQTATMPADNLDASIGNIMAALKEKRDGRGVIGAPINGDEWVDPAAAEYYRHIQMVVSGNWLAPAEAGYIDLVATYRIVIQPDGQVSSSSLVRSSGNESYDLSVERAVEYSSPFRPLPEVFGGKSVPIQLNFKLSDMRRGA